MYECATRWCESSWINNGYKNKTNFKPPQEKMLNLPLGIVGRAHDSHEFVAAEGEQTGRLHTVTVSDSFGAAL